MRGYEGGGDGEAVRVQVVVGGVEFRVVVARV